MSDIFDIAAGKGGDVFDQAASLTKPKKSITRNVIDTFKGAGARVAQGVNAAAGASLDAFGLDQGAEAYKQGAEYWKQVAEDAGSNGIPAKIYEGIGSAPQGISEFMAGVPYAAVKGATKGYKDGGVEGLVKEALIESIKRYGIGKVFHGIQNSGMTPVQQSATMAGTMGAQTAAEGGNLQDVVASTVTGAALSPPGGSGRASVVRSRLMKEGVSPEIATDLSGRVPESLPSVDLAHTEWDQFPTPPKIEVRNPEELPARTERDAVQPKDIFDVAWDESKYPAIKPQQSEVILNGEGNQETGNQGELQGRQEGLLNKPSSEVPSVQTVTVPENTPAPAFNNTATPDAQISSVKPLDSKPIESPSPQPEIQQEPVNFQPDTANTFPHQADVHADALAQKMEQGGLPSDHPLHQELVNERRQRERTPDPETGLIAREHHGPTIDRAFNIAQETGKPFSYADIDLANLGGLNETLGGNAGANPHMKAMLQIVEKVVTEDHPTAQVHRKGGDEFAVFAPGVSEEALNKTLAKAKEAVHAYTVEQGLDKISRKEDIKAGVDNPYGTGIHYGVVDLRKYPSSEAAVVHADNLTLVDKNTRKEAHNVNNRQTDPVGTSSPEGQAGRTQESPLRTGANVPEAGIQGQEANGTIPGIKPPEVTLLHAGTHPIELRRAISRATDYLKTTKVGETIAQAWDGIQRAASPTLRGKQGMKAGEVITEQLGRVAHETEKFLGDINRGVAELRGVVDRKTKALDLFNSSARTLADTVFAKMPESLRLDFMQKMDTGGKQATRELQKIADTIDAMFKDKVRQVQELGTGALDQVRENYFPHIWDRSGNAEAEIMGRISKNPMEGKKDFTKARIFDDVQAGLDAGFKPLSTNPMDLTLLKMAEMDKYILAHKSMQALEGQGVQAIPFTDKTPKGMTDINGRFGAFDRNGTRMRYVAEDQVAQVINNFTSQSLYNNKYVGTPYRVIRAIGDTMNMFQLGVGSAFHAGFTSGEAVVSHVALGMKELARGNFKKGIEYLSHSPVAMVTNAMKGDTVLKAFMGEKTSTDVADIVEYLKMAGAQKSNPNERYFSNQTQKLLENWSNKDFSKALARSPIAAVEQMARPIMEWLVPRHKFGVFAEMAEQWALNHPDATHERTRSAMQQIWNRVDSRLGQVVYTRLFAHNVAKNVAQMMVRAPGWTGGTILEVGGGLKDIADMSSGGAVKAGKGVELSDRAAYTMSLMLVTAVTNGALTAAFTGQAPQGMDFLAFRDGGTDEKGKASRFLLPTYAKDIYAYYQHPGKTLSDKTHPLFSVLADLNRNKDYYGVQIADPEASAPEKTYQIGKYVVKAFVPFWMRGAQKTIDREGGFDVMAQQSTGDKVRDTAKIAAPFIGVMPATSAYTNSPLEKYMTEQMPKNEQAITQEDADHKQAVYGLANKIIKLQQSGASLDIVAQQAREMVAKGELTERDIKKIDKILEVPQVVRQFEKLSVRAAIKAFNELANDEERKQVQDAYLKKLDRFAEEKPNQFETLKPKILQSVDHIKRLQNPAQ